MLSLLSLKTDWIWIKRFAVIIALLLVTVVSRGATNALAFEYLYLSLMLIFLVMAGWLVAIQVLFTGTVDLNKIVGAVALYLILGLIWSIFYVLVLEAFPALWRRLLCSLVA